MNLQESIDYNRIERAIAYLYKYAADKPTLEEISKHVGLSSAHFQRMFTNWAGVSPKKFSQYISIQYAKQLLGKNELTLFDVAHETGLSGTGRLHDLFVTIEGMTPGVYKSKGRGVSIFYAYYPTLFGAVLIASTKVGVCYVGFSDDATEAFNDLERRFFNADFIEASHEHHKAILQFFSNDWNNLEQVKLHLKGTEFQLKVWEALLKIPMGNLTTYGKLAEEINQPKASRAVGTAIGSNPIAFLIPCHRVIQSSGAFGGYMWGVNKKRAVIGWEAASVWMTEKHKN